MQPLHFFLAASWRAIPLGAIFLAACGPSKDNGPQITCPAIDATNTDGECDLVSNEQCSDGHFYEIDCGDDATCTCTIDGNQTMSIFASDQTSGFCTDFSTALLETLASDCGWNITTN